MKIPPQSPPALFSAWEKSVTLSVTLSVLTYSFNGLPHQGRVDACDLVGDEILGSLRQ